MTCPTCNHSRSMHVDTPTPGCLLCDAFGGECSRALRRERQIEAMEQES